MVRRIYFLPMPLISVYLGTLKNKEVHLKLINMTCFFNQQHLQVTQQSKYEQCDGGLV